MVTANQASIYLPFCQFDYILPLVVCSHILYVVIPISLVSVTCGLAWFRCLPVVRNLDETTLNCSTRATASSYKVCKHYCHFTQSLVVCSHILYVVIPIAAILHTISYDLKEAVSECQTLIRYFETERNDNSVYKLSTLPGFPPNFLGLQICPISIIHMQFILLL
jgi:hypothetical protein